MSAPQVGSPLPPANVVGVVLRFAARPSVFVSVSASPRLCKLPPITKIPASPPECLGVAMTADGVVPVIALGPSRKGALYCREDEQSVLLVGFDEALTGAFPSTEGGVLIGDAAISRLSLHGHLSTIIRSHRGGNA